MEGKVICYLLRQWSHWFHSGPSDCSKWGAGWPQGAAPCWHDPKPGRAQLLLLCFSKSSVYFLLFALLYWTGPTFNEIVLRPHSNFIVLGLMLQKDTFYWALFQQLNKPLRHLCLNTSKVIAICLLYFVFPSNLICIEIAIIPAQVQAEIVPANLLSYCGYLVAPACLPHFTGQGGLN